MVVVFKCQHCDSTIEADSEISGNRAECPACNEIVLVPAPGIESGMMLGGYRIERKLGVGGMGEVFEATQLAMDRLVALKILPPAFTADERQVDRFIHEVRMAAKLEHPNIVTAFDGGEAEGYHYLAMSYVDGEDLDHRLKREKRIDEQEALEIVSRVASALEYAWTKFQMLHRDIKPANIMITNEGEVKLMDMGIAKSLSEDSNLTMKGMLVGTPFYMSPEQATASADIDCRSDIYSLGATLYHMVTGRRPFDGPNAMAVVAKHISEKPPEPSSLNTSLSRGCNNLIVRMMARERDARFPDWAALRKAAGRILSGEAPTVKEPAPITVGPDDDLSLKQKPEGTADAVTAPTMLSTAATLPDEEYEPALPGDADASSVKGVKWGMFVAAAIGVLVMILIVFAIYAIIKGVENENERLKVEGQKTVNESQETAKEIDEGIAKYTERALTREDLEEMLKLADEYASANKDNIAGIRVRYEKIRKHAKESKLPVYEMKAENALTDLDNRIKKEDAGSPREVMAELRQNSAKLASRHQYLPAALLLEQYTGPDEFVTTTQKARDELAVRYRNEWKRIRPLEDVLRRSLRLLEKKNMDELQALLLGVRKQTDIPQDDRLIRENLFPLSMLIKSANQESKRPPRRPGRPHEPGHAQAIVRAYKACKRRDYAQALEILEPHQKVLLVQVMRGEINHKRFLGSWKSTDISGPKYTGKTKSLSISLAPDTAKVSFNGADPITGKSWMLGDFLYLSLESKEMAWQVASAAGDRLTLAPSPEVFVRLSKQ